MDIFYVNGLILLYTKTGKTNFLLVKYPTSKGTTSFLKEIEEIKQNMTQEVSK